MMARTQFTGLQVGDGKLQRADLDATTAGSAVIRKVIAGKNVALTSTGADAGTGDVTIDALVLGTGGRLTLTSGVPVTTSDVTGATTIYYTPYVHNVISLWDGTVWQPTVFTETSLALGTGTAFTPYDVFGYLSAGALVLEKLAWLNATVTMTIANPGVVTWTAHGMSANDPVVFTTSGALPTGLSANTKYFVVSPAANTFSVLSTPGGAAINTSGSQSGTHTGWQSKARGTAVTLQDGRYCKSGDKTRLYLGTFYTTSTTTTEDSLGGVSSQSGGKRFLWNRYNRAPRSAQVIDTTDNWSYNTATIRLANGASAPNNCVEFVTGLNECQVDALAHGVAFVYSNTVTALCGVGVDSVAAFSGLRQSGFNSVTSGGIYTQVSGAYSGYPGIGYHYIAMLEKGADGVCFFVGDNGGDGNQTGLIARVWS